MDVITRAGTLRHKVNIEEKTGSGVSTLGKPSLTWEVILERVPASLETLSGRETELARQLVATATHRITLRYQPEITVKCRVVWGDRVYGIGHINNVDQRNRKLILTVTEEQ